jgi:chromosome segregation ATPase
MIHPAADRDECMLYIGELEREIERLHTDYSILKADYDAQRTELDNAVYDRDEKETEIEQLRIALRDLVNRWSTKRGFDSAIQRARHILGEKP